MPLTILDAQDAWLGGKAAFEEWKQQNEAAWYGPLGETLMRMLWSRITPEQKTALQMMNPQAYNTFRQMFGGQEDGL